MKIRLDKNIPTIVEIFKVMEKFDLEMELNLGENGISVQVNDKARIAAVLLDLDKELFSEYMVDVGEKIGIDLERFNKMFDKLKNSENITIETEETDIKLESGHLKYQIAQKHMDEECSKLPDIEYGTIIKMPYLSYTELLNNLDVVDNADVKLTSVSTDKIALEIIDSLRTKAKTELQVEIEGNTDFKAILNMDYLKKFKLKGFDELKICLPKEEGLAVKVIYKENGINIEFYLSQIKE